MSIHRNILSKSTTFILLFYSIFLFFSCNNDIKHDNIKELILDYGWEFKADNDTVWMPTTIPGEVYTGLLANNKIQNPFYGINEKKLQHLEEKNWIYKNEFEANTEILSSSKIVLNLTGIDTYADVFLNDSLILKADNMFRSYQVDIKPFLKSQNTLTFNFTSPINKHKNTADSLGFQPPASNDASDKKVSIFTRKAPYHFGWDWAPRLISAGITETVSIIGINKLKIKDYYAETKSITKEKASLKIHIQLDVVSSGKYEFNINNNTSEFNLKQGEQEVIIPIDIQNPQLWNPIGYGSPNIYNIDLQINRENIICDKESLKFGIRNIKLIQENDSIGENFY